MERELHRPAKHSRFGRRAVARKGSHQVDAILVPAAARAGREDEKLGESCFNEDLKTLFIQKNSLKKKFEETKW